MIENGQVGKFFGDATDRGEALLDRKLYLPKGWAADRPRRTRAGVPVEVIFATKIAWGRRMIDWAAAAGVPAKWVTADAVSGADYHFRRRIEEHGLGCVVGVRTDHCIHVGWRQARAW